MSIVRKILYGSGDTPNSITSTVISLFFMFFLTEVIGMRAIYAGLVVLIGNVWDAITDPWLGHMSDNSRSAFGRRRSFLRAAAIPYCLGFIAVWFVPEGLSQLTSFIFATSFYMLYVFFQTMYSVPYKAMSMELTPDYDERTSIMAYVMFFSIAFGLVAAVVPKMIIDAFDGAAGYRMMGVVFGAASVLFCFLPLFSGKELNRGVQAEKFNYFKNIRLALSNRPFLMVVFIYLLTWTCMGLVQSMLLYYVKYFLGMENQFEIIMAVIFGVAIIMLPVWVKISIKYDKRIATAAGLGLFGSVLALLLLPSDMIKHIMWPLTAVLGIGVSAVHVMPPSLLPEAVDYSRQLTGIQSEATHYGIMTFMQKIGTALALAAAGAILEVCGYIPATAGTSIEQPYSALLALKFMLGLVPPLFFAVCVLLALRFPLSRNGRIKSGSR